MLLQLVVDSDDDDDEVTLFAVTYFPSFSWSVTPSVTIAIVERQRQQQALKVTESTTVAAAWRVNCSDRALCLQLIPLARLLSRRPSENYCATPPRTRTLHAGVSHVTEYAETSACVSRKL
jgi:hypothetical protein